MNELPKRDDKIYKEIEEFKDYELTYCVAYEMAIRNDEVKGLLKELEDKRYDYRANGHNYDKELNNVKVLAKMLPDFKKYGFSLWTMPNYYGRSDKQKYQYYANYIKNNEVLAFQEDCNIFFIEDNKNKINKDEGIIKKIKLNFSRPKLYFDNSRVISVEINPALPKKELLAYIEKIKDDFDKGNLKIQTPAELLEEEIQKADNLVCNDKGKCFDPRATLTKQQKVADMFFIYDYATYRMKEIKKYNARYKAELNEKLSFIKNNKTLTSKEKKIQEMEARKKYLEDKSEATIKSICNEDEICNQIGLKGDSIYKYYLAIKPYIEEKRYKELITGISTL